MSYEHLAGKPKGDFKIDEAVLFSFPEEDLAVIERDWETIMNKIRAGKAHELSEGDTLYLAACTKGETAASVRRQPFSEVPAKQRAYSLKASYMTQILRKYIFGNAKNPRIIKSADVLITPGSKLSCPSGIYLRYGQGLLRHDPIAAKGAFWH